MPGVFVPEERWAPWSWASTIHSPCAPTVSTVWTTPAHATFLAMQHEPAEAYDTLRTLQREIPGSYSDGGFFDSVAVRSGTVAQRYLSLDQAMIKGSIGNVVGPETVRRAFCAGPVRRRIRPLITRERFGAGLV